MEIKTLTLGELATNCYIVISAAGNAAVIDPAEDAQRILDTLGKENAELKMILLTHGQRYIYIQRMNVCSMIR